ncbi:gluconate 2-dehydrogenase subunit 3 family protein [Halosimplex litoreum]|uniref:Gluconate 2-dehydrogenase subunit 3 family protein n=1 Tax=Halosimplex litoreum TaxID=1198301 RepID=A0A7T3FYJ6_9EURY|nr:gluconate 2-dehydrogenase subunit 3 family protein [Halosimplex litoreum]QPV62957.1 gluconate 2-dehydrogenase subunit 3 family protein [Halosimplex litoreum]
MTTDDTELTRRDAIAALAAAGITGSAALAGCSTDDDATRADETAAAGADAGPPPDPLERRHLDVLTAAADVLYPSDLDGADDFVERFARGRAAERSDHAAGVAETADYVVEWSRSWLGGEFPALEPDRREEALDRIGAREADPDPEGSDAERVRYYVVNELLFALYASPTGGELVGIENPQGHPGGTESYRRGPQ